MFVTLTGKQIMLCGLAALVVMAVGFAALLRGQPRTRPVAAPAQAGRCNVVIDAGHGGEDGGAVSPTGYYESHINLAIARRLEMIFNLYGHSTIMTRRTDISIHDGVAGTIRQKKVSDLKNRVKLVNETENALLISIHQNIFAQSRFFGAQCFYNGKPGSETLANALQAQLTQKLDPENKRETKPVPSGVYLFANIDCPAVLIECGFLSNAGDLNKLIDSAYQTKMAAAIFGAYTEWEGR